MEAMTMEAMMRGPTISDFKRAISEQYGVRSNIIAGERVAVNGWVGDVLVFALLDHPMARFCYAWSTDRGLTVALHRAPIDSPQAAVLSTLASANAGHAGADAVNNGSHVNGRHELGRTVVEHFPRALNGGASDVQ